MSKRAIVQFRERVSQDKGLQEKIRNGMNLVDLAKSYGFDFSENELANFNDELLNDFDTELSDFELEMVSGGIVNKGANSQKSRF